jgi:hypothetical protein
MGYIPRLFTPIAPERGDKRSRQSWVVFIVQQAYQFFSNDFGRKAGI